MSIAGENMSMSGEGPETDSPRTFPLKVYTAEPLLKRPLALASEMLADLRVSSPLAWRLFVRDLNAQYRQTWLGYLWAFLPPLVTSFTFIFLNSQGILSVETEMPYAAFAMIGTLLWQVFVDALQSPVQALNTAKPMLAKINFPREAILMAGIGTVIFNFLVRLVLLAGVLLYYSVPLTPAAFLFPVAAVALMTFGLAVGLAVTPFGALYGDVTRAIPVVSGFWMLLTPVVYPPQEAGIAGFLSQWNPVSPLIVTARELISGQPLTFFFEWLIVFGASLLVCALGWLAFRLALPHIIVRIGG